MPRRGLPVGDLGVTEWGEGQRVVLLHRSLSNGVQGWANQRPLADAGFHLVLPDRRGYGRSPQDVAEDYERDAEDIAPLLGDGAHLVGHSYGALSALWTAALHPDIVRSLTVIEPPAFGLVADDPDVVEFMATFRSLWSRAELSDREFLREFLLVMNTPTERITEEALDEGEESVASFRNGRGVWDATVPVDVLNAVFFPTLVVSGGHSAAFDVVCKALVESMGAATAVLPGAGHMVPMLGESFNATVSDFWRAADAERLIR